MKAIFRRFVSIVILIAVLSNICVVPAMAAHTHKGAMCGKKLTWYEDITSSSHTVVTAYEDMCSCGEVIGTIDEVRKKESHSFSGNTCSKCGYTKNTHTHKGAMCGDKVTWYDDITSTTHTYYTANESLCSCGKYMGLVDQTSTVQNHSFNGDTCTKCNYTRAHEHRGSMCGQNYTILESYDSSTHTFVTGYDELCSCGVALGWVPVSSVTSSHNYSGDTCRDCGYTRSHVHQGAMCGQTISWVDAYDQYTHTIATGYEDICSCGEVVGWTVTSTVTSSHDYSGDSCRDCGYTRSHVHQGVMCGDFYTWYEDINSETHTYVTANEDMCSCGEILGWTDMTWTVESHTFIGEDTCRDCGYTRSHVHQGAMCGSAVNWYGDITSETHTYYTANENLCSCGEYLGLIDEYSITETHNFSGDVCRDCGYTREHVHQGAMCGNEKIWYENINEDAHRRISVYEDLCSCGEVIGELERTETIEQHYFENNICVHCGYCKPDQDGHVHKANQCGPGFTFYLYINETAHTRVVYEGDHLCSCGEVVAEGDYVEYVEEHELKDEVCVHCGIEIHIHQPAEKAETGRHYLYSDKNQHVVIRVNGGSYCDCGEFLAESDNDVTYTYEEHTFSDEKCTKCGYSTKSYLEVTGEQIIYGDFSDDANLAGVAGQIIVGELPGVGLVADIRDLLASETPADVFINLIGFLPLIGSLKYSDEVYVVFKHVPDASDIPDIPDIPHIPDVPNTGTSSEDLKKISQIVMRNGEDIKYTENMRDVNYLSDNLTEGYVDYDEFKKIYGSAGEGYEWHHVVEQSQIDKSGFDPRLVNNPGNIIPIDAATHRKVSGYYRRIVPGTNMVFRDWLTAQGYTYEQQQQIGEYVLEMFGIKVN